MVEAPEQLPVLPAAIEVAAYYIALAAITNVVEHAHARHCGVRLAVTDALELEIVDDGCGLPPPGAFRRRAALNTRANRGTGRYVSDRSCTSNR